MTDQKPTTFNGLLHTPEADLGDRRMEASFETVTHAEAARDRLIQAGVAADRITIVGNAAEDATVQARLAPDDKGLVARIREAIVPDDSNTATRKAARNNDTIMEIRPARDEVERVIQVIEASDPTHFDASLERWRNIG